MRNLAFVPALLALGACADQGLRPGAGGPADDMTRLQRDCDGRGGMLSPSGRNTGQASLDYVCKINGPAPPSRG